MTYSSVFECLFGSLPLLKDHHAPGSPVYALLQKVARMDVERAFGGEEPAVQEFRPFGEIVFPYHKMGAVDSLNLFDIDELIIFSFYWVNRMRYSRVLDVGANLGLHSIVLSRCGFEVQAFEPDPRHFAILEENLARNGCANVRPSCAAVSSRTGMHEFVRVLGNTTGSHLSGAKPNPYGELERFPVRVESIVPLLNWAELMKLDAEGHEAEILRATTPDQWRRTDAIVEVGSQENAAAIFDHFGGRGVHLFSQKNNWRRVKEIADMPVSHLDGSLFITSREDVPWAVL